LKIAIEAALQRNEPIDHVLLRPPGLGKTTWRTSSPARRGQSDPFFGPGPREGGDLIGILTHLNPATSVHRRNSQLPKPVEVALPDHGDFAIDFVFARVCTPATTDSA
jgi:Holliday junction DNA helicase RuvB